MKNIIVSVGGRSGREQGERRKSDRPFSIAVLVPHKYIDLVHVLGIQ
jgi:hypothetical protein